MLGGMVRDELEAMLAADERHWWYRGRRRVIRAQLDRLGLSRRSGLVALDAGCGSGRNLDVLADYGTAFGVDLSQRAVEEARARGHARVSLGRVEGLPFANQSFDLVTCLDVLEHVPDDRRVLRELRRVTRPGGMLVVTVPAYPALWSAHDVLNGHHRRYRRASLDAAATAAGWQGVSTSHFNSALLAPAAMVRLARRGRDGGGSDLERTPAALNGLLELPLRAEAALVRGGFRLPFGLSLLGVYRAVPRGRRPGRRQLVPACSGVQPWPQAQNAIRTTARNRHRSALSAR